MNDIHYVLIVQTLNLLDIGGEALDFYGPRSSRNR